MAKKMGGVYKNSQGSMSGEKYMISEDLSQPGNMPRGVKSVQYPYMDCGGQMMDGSVRRAERESDARARKMREQSPDSQF